MRYQVYGTDPETVKCWCGQMLTCYAHVNVCPRCGRSYDTFGMVSEGTRRTAMMEQKPYDPTDTEEFFVEGENMPGPEEEWDGVDEEPPDVDDSFPIELEYNDIPGVNAPVDRYPFEESDFLYDVERDRGRI